MKKNETMANFKVFRTCSYCVFYFSVLSVVLFPIETSKFVHHAHIKLKEVKHAF